MCMLITSTTLPYCWPEIASSRCCLKSDDCCTASISVDRSFAEKCNGGGTKDDNAEVRLTVVPWSGGGGGGGDIVWFRVIN